MLVYFIVWTFEQWRPRQYFLTEFCLVSRLTIAQHRDQHRNNTRNNKKKLHKSFETQNWQETTTQRKNKKTQTTRTGIDAISIAPMQRNVKGGGGITADPLSLQSLHGATQGFPSVSLARRRAMGVPVKTSGQCERNNNDINKPFRTALPLLGRNTWN